MFWRTLITLTLGPTLVVGLLAYALVCFCEHARTAEPRLGYFTNIIIDFWED